MFTVHSNRKAKHYFDFTSKHFSFGLNFSKKICVIFSHRIFNFATSERYFFAESKNQSKQSFLTVFDMQKGEIVLKEKALDLPPAVFLKSASADFCVFAECGNEDLPEISFFHFADIAGNIIGTEKHFAEREKRIFTTNFYPENSIFHEEVKHLTGKKNLQGGIFYAETTQSALVLYAEENLWQVSVFAAKEVQNYAFPEIRAKDTEKLIFSVYERFFVIFSPEENALFLRSFATFPNDN